MFLICSFLRLKFGTCLSSSSHGRGATRNPTPTRFNLKERLAEGEWLDQVEALDGDTQAPDHGHDRASKIDPDAQQLARHRF